MEEIMTVATEKKESENEKNQRLFSNFWAIRTLMRAIKKLFGFIFNRFKTFDQILERPNQARGFRET